LRPAVCTVHYKPIRVDARRQGFTKQASSLSKIFVAGSFRGTDGYFFVSFFQSAKNTQPRYEYCSKDGRTGCTEKWHPCRLNNSSKKNDRFCIANYLQSAEKQFAANCFSMQYLFIRLLVSLIASACFWNIFQPVINRQPAFFCNAYIFISAF